MTLPGTQRTLAVLACLWVLGPTLNAAEGVPASRLSAEIDRLIDAGCGHNTQVAQVNGECLPFEDNSFNCITIAFGLRNITDKDAALRSMLRVLKPGGRLLVLEFSQPVHKPLSKLYDLYSFAVWPRLGKMVVNDSESYRYLAESIRMHPDQDTLKGMMDEAGFQRSEYFNMLGGIVALHRGFKV